MLQVQHVVAPGNGSMGQRARFRACSVALGQGPDQPCGSAPSVVMLLRFASATRLNDKGRLAKTSRMGDTRGSTNFSVVVSGVDFLRGF